MSEELSECKTCGFQIATSELLARFEAGLGKCPNCNVTGKNIKQSENGELYIADGEFQSRRIQ